MLILSSFLVNLCSWLMLSSAWCLKVTATANLLETEVIDFHTEKYVRPFDLISELPTINHDDYTHEFVIGKVKLIKALAAIPYFFSASFSIYSREGSTVDIQVKPTVHRIHLKDQANQVRQSIYEFNLTQLSYPNNPFRANRRTVIIVPGYMSGSGPKWLDKICSKWLNLEDVNVILVYWPNGNTNLYATAVANTRIVSRQITIFLYYLAELNGISFRSKKFRESLQFVGHSLGAHICGFVGQDLGSEVGRITGLDPAGPIFDKQEPEMRLDRGDAILVDVVHTNAGRMRYVKAGLGILKKAFRGMMSSVWTGKNSNLAISMLDSFHSDDDTAWFGLSSTLGHMDFYANGGSVQPGCNDQLHICDHKRATDLYVNALDHEIHARLNHGPDSEMIRLGLHRLVAFPSHDYERFQSGLVLIRNCPLLLSSNSLGESRDRRISEYKRCTVPLDFITSGPKLKNELELDYNIPLQDDSEERQYFFSTLSADPFIGEHYLMKIHFAPDGHDNWARGCKLTSLIHAYDIHNLYSQINYQPAKLFPYATENFNGIILLFASPVDWRSAHPTSQNLNEQLRFISNQPDFETDYFAALRYFFPGNVSLGITYTGESDSIFGNLNGMLSFGREKVSSKCLLTISAVEVRPLFSMIHNISVWYFNDTQETPISPIREDEELDYMKHDKSFHLKLNMSHPYAMIFPTIFEAIKSHRIEDL